MWQKHSCANTVKVITEVLPPSSDDCIDRLQAFYLCTVKIKKNKSLTQRTFYLQKCSEWINCMLFFFWFGWVLLFYFFHPLSPWTQLSWADASIDVGGKGLKFPHVSNKTAQWCIFSNRIHLIWGDTFCKICGHQSTMCCTLLVSSCCALMIIQLPVFVKAIVDFQAFPNNLMK